MIYDLTASSNGRKLPVPDAGYPQDKSVTFIKGNSASATFNAVISEDGRPAKYTYQWYLNGSAVSGATSSSYTISGFTASGSHSIYCVITNAAGAVQTRTATLTVTMYTLPVLNTSYPANASKTFISGGSASATFEVKIATAGVPASYTYQWYVNDAAVSGATKSSYTWSGSTAGTYTVYCKVTNAAGTVTSRVATLTVVKYYTPVLNSSYPANATVVKGNSVTSKVAIATAGNPASYTYQWYKNGSAVSGATGSSYTFTPAAVGTTTVYCKVTNAAGTVTSRTATITCNPVYLYNAGDECTALTGGWVSTVKALSSDVNTTAADITFTKGDSNMYLANGGGYGAIMYATNKIDLSQYSTIGFEGTMTKESSSALDKWVGLYIWTEIGSVQLTNIAASKQGASGDFTLDISSLDGSYVIGFGVYSFNSTSVTVEKLYLY